MPATLLTPQFSKSTLDDAVLIERALKGEEFALDELYRRHAGFVASVIARLLRRPSETEDLVQETLLKAWEMRRSYRTGKGSSWFAWCRRIADRLWIDAWRSPRSVETVSIEDRLLNEEGSAPWEIPPLRSPFENAASEARFAALQAAVKRLPKAQRQVLELRGEGYSIAEIADALSIAETTAKAYLYRARLALRKVSAREALAS
jgi:RNA polymerase sigma-70 factor (ECF subfamily)